MPFRSARQRQFMFARHPIIARRWARRYGTMIMRKGRRRK